MAQAPLVDWDINSGARMLDALATDRIPVDHAFWSAELEDGALWTFHIITPRYDQQGPRKTWDLIDASLQRAGIATQFRESLQVSGPGGISAKLQQHLETPGLSASPAVGGAYMPSVVPYVGGTIAIILEDPAVNRFRVTFSPYRGPVGAMRPVHLHGTINLTLFLVEQLKIDEYIPREAVVRAAMTGRWSIPNVNLSTDELKSHGLAA